ncbi:MAG: DUF1573 domain-containing protein [Phycisphaerales bacterium]|nr:DUF1573 domain-containing protein [Phycisphaerales bacterium]
MWNGLIGAIGSAVILAAATAGPGVGMAAAQSGPTYEVRRPPQSSPPPIEVIPEEVAFGDVMPESHSTMAVTLVNTGPDPLKITDIRTSCNCTTTDLPTRLLMPNEPVTMQASLAADKFMGKMRRNIVIFCEGYAQPRQIYVTCWVNYGVRTIVRYEPEGQYRIGEMSLEAVDGEPFTVLAANGERPVFADGFDPARDDPRAAYTLKVDLSGIAESDLPKWYLVETDHRTAPVIDVRVMGVEQERTRRPWQVSHERVLLWRLAPGASEDVTLTLQNLLGSPLDVIEDISCDNPDVEVELLGMMVAAEGTKVRLRVTPSSDLRGLVQARVSITARKHTETFDMFGQVTPVRE